MAVEVVEVVEDAEEWLSFWLILLRKRSRSAIFLSKLAAVEDATEPFSASNVLNEDANWLKAASKGSEEDEDGVEIVDEGDEKSLLEDIGLEDEEEILLLP